MHTLFHGLPVDAAVHLGTGTRFPSTAVQILQPKHTRHSRFSSRNFLSPRGQPLSLFLSDDNYTTPRTVRCGISCLAATRRVRLRLRSVRLSLIPVYRGGVGTTLRFESRRWSARRRKRFRLSTRIERYRAVSSRYTCSRHGSRPIRVPSRFYDPPERSTPATGRPFRRPVAVPSPIHFRVAIQRYSGRTRGRGPAVRRNPVEKGLARAREVDRIAMPGLQPVQRGLVFPRQTLFVALLSRPWCAPR